MIDYADRIKRLPPYLFEEIDRAKQKALEEQRPVIDLGVGDPDQPTPEIVVNELRRASLDPSTHKYALNKGLKKLREAMARWYEARFNVELDPDTEVLPLLGSKDGISHIPLAFVNPGDTVLLPDPGYPPYNSGAVFSGAEVYRMPLLKENDFLPDLENIKNSVLSRSKLIHINYPNNPTGAVCDLEFYEKVVSFAKKNEIIVCSDAAYTEIAFDGFDPPSLLQVKGARETGIEFHSLSKTFNMTGWRVGMAVGNPAVLAGLAKVKANVDSGIFTAIQIASIKALENADSIRNKAIDVYTERRNVLVDGLIETGWQITRPKATFYIWAPVFGDYDSTGLAKALLEKTDIVVTPGIGFGNSGEGYIRMALTVDAGKLKESVGRIKRAFFP